MAFKDDEIKRLIKKERSRGKRHPGPDPDVLAVNESREKIVEELLNLESEDEFLAEFKRAMNDCGLRVGRVHLNRALQLYRARHQMI